LANVDKITIVSTGNGDAAGMNKVTGDMAKMAAQVPALFETLSGMKMSDLFANVRMLGDKGNPPVAPSNDGPSGGDAPVAKGKAAGN
jgi:flotillin